MRMLGVFRFLLGAAFGALPFALAAGGCADVTVEGIGTPPTVTKLLPTSGPSAGGTPVVITGTGFAKGATVRFGGTLAADVKYVDDTTLSVVTPPGLGKVSVSVENPNHLVGTAEDAFLFEGEAIGCSIVGTTPAIGAAEVPIVGDLQITFSAAVDPATLDAVKLQLLGGDEVPADVTVSPDDGAMVLVHPKQSLRFWGSYAVIVGEGLTTSVGSPCAQGALAFATVKPVPAKRALRPAVVNGLARVGSSVITASEGYKGFQTYDVADPKSAALKSDLVTKFGPRAVLVDGTTAYAPSGQGGVHILDVTDPAAPQDLGHAGTPGFASDAAILKANGKKCLAIADGGEGLRIEDVTDPENVVDLGTVNLGGSAKPLVGKVDVDGDTLAVTDGSRFVLVKLTDPGSPAAATVLGALDTGAGIADIAIAGGRVFVSRATDGVASYDVTNPAAPALLGSAPDPDGPCTGDGGCLDAGGQLVKDGGDLFVVFGRGAAQRYTIAGNGALTLSTHYAGPTIARSVLVDGSTLYVGADEGLYVFDRNGDGTKPLWFDPNGHGNARTATVAGDFAYVGDSFRGVQTFSLKDPEAPALVDRDETATTLDPKADIGVYGVSASGAILAVGDGRKGVTLFDLSDPANPVIGGTTPPSDAMSTVLAGPKLTFGCATNQGVMIVDSSSAKSATLLAKAALDDVNVGDSAADVAPLGDLVFVGRRVGLGVLDVSNPSAPAWKALFTLPTNEAFTNVRVVDKTHVIATTRVADVEGPGNFASHLVVMDVADPSSPTLAWMSEEIGGASGLAVIGDVAFVATGSPEVRVYDLADVAHPALEGTILGTTNVSYLAVGKDVLYAVQGPGGFSAIHTGPLPKTN
ncbi:MAG: IPT/TIG domain-containing protein [Polyangiaceae bacterium]